MSESRVGFRGRRDLHPALHEVGRGSGASISCCCYCKKKKKALKLPLGSQGRRFLKHLPTWRHQSSHGCTLGSGMAACTQPYRRSTPITTSQQSPRAGFLPSQHSSVDFQKVKSNISSPSIPLHQGTIIINHIQHGSTQGPNNPSSAQLKASPPWLCPSPPTAN